jgi:hypothetical protein
VAEAVDQILLVVAMEALALAVGVLMAIVHQFMERVQTPLALALVVGVHTTLVVVVRDQRALFTSLNFKEKK